MSHKPQAGTSLVRSAMLFAALSGIAALTACSTNGGGGSVTIANSQPADSQTTDFGIAYVKRTVPPAGKQDDLRLPRAFLPSADLFIRNPTNNGGAEVNITARVTSTAPKGTFYDIKDVDVSSDGTRIIFAMRGPVTATQMDLKPPNWNIYEYVVAQDLLQPLLPESDPQGTQSQYISPHYLPDDRVLFATTRQVASTAVLLNEGKQGFEAQTEDLNESAFDLHVMGTAGVPNPSNLYPNLHQISFNQSHDVDVTVLQSGRILWSRWDHANGVNGFNLYSANPDGTDVQLVYGKGSHQTVSTNPGQSAACPAGADCTVEFTRPREMPNGKILALVRPFTNANFGGDLQIIDIQHFVEDSQAFPDAAQNVGASTTTFAQQPATQNAIVTAVDTATMLPLISTGGRFSSGFPLWDGTGRILVTWNQCRLQDSTGNIVACTDANLALTTGANPTLKEAPVLYSVWMFDPVADTYKPVITPVEGVFLTDVVALQPRPVAPLALNDNYTNTSTPVAVLDIRSVYDWDGAPSTGLPAGGISYIAQVPADQRQARFLRLEKAVSIPNKQTLNFDRNTAFGVAGNYMREILGYVPIEPDGSVRVKVPANVAFQISVVDANGQRLFAPHHAWLYLLPGEEVKCNGCHVPQAQQTQVTGLSTYSHGRAGTFQSIWSGAAGTGPFPGTLGSYTTCQGDTMAETLVGYECGNAANAAALAATPSVNLSFTDPWFGGGTGNEPLLVSYDDASFTTPLPTSQSCALPNGQGGWTTSCRVVINYPTVIQPLWDKDRGANTCVTCHTGSTATDAYLDLTGGASTVNANQATSYPQLLQGFSLTTVDATTGQTTTTQVRSAEFISADARDSHFFAEFLPGATHDGFLSRAELKLLSEWVDIGAQYYNNPFAAPLAN